MLTYRGFALVAVPAVILSAAGVFVASSSASTAAAPTTFSVTVTGTAMRSLDARVALQVVPNTGGGATPSYEAGAAPATPRVYIEAGLDLPLNAKVTSVSFTVTAGDRTGCLGEPLQFGSYSPTNADFTAPISFTTPFHTSPCTRQTITKTGSPIATVAAGRHYVVRWNPVIAGAYPGDAFSSGIFEGATVKYSCTTPCVP